jgi:two-component system response regulator FixJ
VSFGAFNVTIPASEPAAQRLVHIVDDDEILRDVAEHQLAEAGYRVVQHSSGASFLSVLDDAEAGCVLLDMHMPEIGGLEVQQTLKSRAVDWPVIVLTAQGDVRLAVEAMKNGAFEFLQKPFDAEGLTAVLQDAFDKFEAANAEAAETQRARQLIGTLSGRELQVMQGLLAGLPNKLIAHELDLSVRTVEIYRGKVMEKLQARGLSTAVRLALAAGVEPLEEGAAR